MLMTKVGSLRRSTRNAACGSDPLVLCARGDDEKVKTRSLELWPIENIMDLGFEWRPVIERVQELLKMVRTARLDKSRFLEWSPDADSRPHMTDALWFHIDRFTQELEDIRNCVVNTLDGVIEEAELTVTSTGVGFISPGPVHETWMSDSLIPSDLKTVFVLDLVHPSLYCCVYGKTKRVPAAESSDNLEDMTVEEHMKFAALNATETVVKPTGNDNDDFQWIPSDLVVDDDGNVKIQSYINNLHPIQHAAMYESIGSIFQHFVPLFDRVLTCLANPTDALMELELSDMYECRQDFTEYLPERLPIPERSTVQPECETQYTLKGTTVQVIVKIAEIHLTPGKPKYTGGSWHIEGTGSEEIVATGLYYFGCENITDSKLSFRVLTEIPEQAQGDHLGMAAMHGLEDEELLAQNLGAATSIENRCLVFPNTLQHKVEPFEVADPTKFGVRKILAFFVVDPIKKIPSSSVIPPQQEEWLKDLSPPVVQGASEMIAPPVGNVMTWEDAVTHRASLMEARHSYMDKAYQSGGSWFSLCEH